MYTYTSRSQYHRHQSGSIESNRCDWSPCWSPIEIWYCFFSLIIHWRRNHHCSYDKQHRGKLNWTQKNRMISFSILKNSVFLSRFSKWSLLAVLLFLFLFCSSTISLSRLETVRSNIAGYCILDLLGRGIVIARQRPRAIVPRYKPLW